MPAYRRTCLLLLLTLCAAPACRPQAPADQAPKPSQEPDCAGYSGWGGHTGWGGAYNIYSGCLSVADGTVQFHTGSDYKTSLFDFPVTELAELQSKKFKFWKGFQFKLKSGKKWDFYAFYDKDTQGPDAAAAVVEKAVRDMAAQHSVPLK